MSTDYNIKKETLTKWLQMLFEITKSDTLNNAISLGKMIATTNEEVEICNTVAVLYRAECSGEINPPIAMRKLYAELVLENTEKETA